ncbi:MAG: alkaline phosphatase family protein [Bacteroidota bacterium]
MRRAPARLCVVAVAAWVAACSPSPTGPDLPPPGDVAGRPGGIGSLDSIRYVVHVSIDGLRPDAVEVLGAELAPNLTRLRREGASTHNARTDPDIRTTLPNHVGQLSGRQALRSDGHGWTGNDGVEITETIHGQRGEYVASVFDVVHNHGLRTTAYVSKGKFWLFDWSYDAENGAPDNVGVDNGTDKIDRYTYHGNTKELTEKVVRDLQALPSHYTFLHLQDPDAAGHEFSWDLGQGSFYLDGVRRVDNRLGLLLDLIESHPVLIGRTALVVTSDHGGSDFNHAADEPEHYTIPFYVWGPGILPADLYAINGRRSDPGARYASGGGAPIWNGDAANVVLGLLGLPPVPRSTLGSRFPLAVTE